MFERRVSVHVRSSSLGTFARLPRSLKSRSPNRRSLDIRPLNLRLRQQRAGFRSGYASNAVSDGRPDCAIYRNRDLRQFEAPLDAGHNQPGDVDLQCSFRGNHQCFRGGDRCKCGLDNHHGQRNGLRWSCQLHRRLHSFRIKPVAQMGGAVGASFRSPSFRAGLSLAVCGTAGSSWQLERSRPRQP